MREKTRGHLWMRPVARCPSPQLSPASGAREYIEALISQRPARVFADFGNQIPGSDRKGATPIESRLGLDPLKRGETNYKTPIPGSSPGKGRSAGLTSRDLKLSALVGGAIVEVGEGIGAQPGLVVRVARRG